MKKMKYFRNIKKVEDKKKVVSSLIKKIKYGISEFLYSDGRSRNNLRIRGIFK
jgi:hypothetical protein